MSIKSEDLLRTLYENKLPQVYREEDSKIKYPLKRYLESLIEGGFKGAIEDIEGLLLLTDPNSVPESLFPFLCESFGLEYFPDIDVTYQRKFLLNLGELVRRRGTFSSIHFLAKVLTGLESEITKDEEDENGIIVTLLAKTVAEASNLDVSVYIVGNYLKTQIPYYINPVVKSRVANQTIISRSYVHSGVTTYKTYKITALAE